MIEIGDTVTVVYRMVKHHERKGTVIAVRKDDGRVIVEDSDGDRFVAESHELRIDSLD